MSTLSCNALLDTLQALEMLTGERIKCYRKIVLDLRARAMFGRGDIDRLVLSLHQYKKYQYKKNQGRSLRQR